MCIETRVGSLASLDASLQTKLITDTKLDE